MRIRNSINHENEVSTMFDFLLYYIKVWKLKTQEALKRNNASFFSFTYDFICDIEATAYDFTKSLLIDADIHEFNNSITVLSIISISIDIFLMTEFTKSKIINSPLFPEIIDSLKLSLTAWNHIVEIFFGKQNLQHIEEFGKYLFMRQQRIFFMVYQHK